MPDPHPAAARPGEPHHSAPPPRTAGVADATRSTAPPRTAGVADATHSAAPQRTAVLAAASIFLGALLLYVRTAAPDLALVDSSELALIGATGGVPHPPGFPLYRLLGELFAKLPVRTPAHAANLMSAFFAALAAGATFLAAERLLAFLDVAASRRSGARLDTAAGSPRSATPDPRVRLFAAAAAALAFATSWNPWTWSAVAEVYSLNVFLLAASWACAWGGLASLAGAGAAARGPGSPRGGRGENDVPRASAPAWRWITSAAFFASFGLANHHATAALAFPVLLLMIAMTRPSLLRASRLWITTALAIAFSLSLYLTLLPAARHDPGLGWGGTTTLALLFRHVIGQQYALQVGASLAESLRVARDFTFTLTIGCGVPTSLLAASGVLVLLLRRPRSRAAFVALVATLAMIALNLALSTRYIAGPEDRMAYDLPATVAWCLLAAIGAQALLARAAAWRVAVAAVLLLVPTSWNAVRNLPFCDLHRERTARVFAAEMLGGLPKGAIVMTAEWDLVAPYLYLRHAEGWRADLRVIDTLMMRRFWYLDYVERAHPDLVSASRREFDVFRNQIRLFDLGKPYDQAHMQEYYDALMTRWVELGKAEGGAYSDWICPTIAQEASWMRRLPSAPDGLLLRFPAAGESPTSRPLPACDVANLRYVGSKLTDASLAGDRASLVPRHDPYWKVWSQYQAAVAAALIVAGREGDDVFEARQREIAAWFPETERVAAQVRALR